MTSGFDLVKNPAIPIAPATRLERAYIRNQRLFLVIAMIKWEVIAHLSGLVGAKVRVTLEIDAEVESGVPDNVVRTVTENSRTLKFTSQGFESD